MEFVVVVVERVVLLVAVASRGKLLVQNGAMKDGVTNKMKGMWNVKFT